MRWFQRLLEQWIVEQIDLPYREIVRGSPIGVEARQFLLTQHVGFFALGCGFRHRIELLWNGSRPKLYSPRCTTSMGWCRRDNQAPCASFRAVASTRVRVARAQIVGEVERHRLLARAPSAGTALDACSRQPTPEGPPGGPPQQ